MRYTGRVEGFEIRDLTYLGDPPKNRMPVFDVVKFETTQPCKVHDLRTGEEKVSSGYCYTVATIEWNVHDGGFDLVPLGTRWLHAHPSMAVQDMVLDFMIEKSEEYDPETLQLKASWLTDDGVYRCPFCRKPSLVKTDFCGWCGERVCKW